MGILRADRITGLGGANAIKGSVSFNNNSGDYYNGYLIVNLDSSSKRSNFDFDGDFTIECWVFKSKSTESGNYDGLLYISDDWRFKWQASNKIMYYDNGTDAQIINYNTNEGFLDNRWHHIAIVRSSNTITGYVDGTSYGTASESGDFDPGSADELRIGYNVQGFGGNISNLRVVKGTAVYTSNFTPPTSELTAIDGTVLLCCQSPADPTQEATGNYIVESVVNPTADVRFSKPPTSSHFTPNTPVGFSTTSDVGSQYGTTFDGFGLFATSTYMVPPGGNTRERNRGRGVFGGGYAPSPASLRNIIDYVEINTLGNAKDFGDLLSINNGESGACSSSTRALYGGGNGNDQTITFITIASTSNATDFGDLITGRRSLNAVSSDTRGLFAGGTTPAMKEEIEFSTIATAGNATDFGDLFVGRRNMASNSSPTRGVFAGGNPGSSPLKDDTMDYVTIATAGDALDFGNLITAMREQGGSSSATRGLIAGGYTAPANLNTIEYITIASTGAAQDFGDLHTAVAGLSGTSNGTRGIFAGGSYINNIQYVTIATLGDAADFGDLTLGRLLYEGTSDSHGGIT